MNHQFLMLWLTRMLERIKKEKLLLLFLCYLTWFIPLMFSIGRHLGHSVTTSSPIPYEVSLCLHTIDRQQPLWLSTVVLYPSF